MSLSELIDDVLPFERAAHIIAFTTCGHCGNTIPQSLCFEHRGEHYCNPEHAESEMALEKLREAGL